MSTRDSNSIEKAMKLTSEAVKDPRKTVRVSRGCESANRGCVSVL
jgi:hypothetical protein